MGATVTSWLACWECNRGFNLVPFEILVLHRGLLGVMCWIQSYLWLDVLLLPVWNFVLLQAEQVVISMLLLGSVFIMRDYKDGTQQKQTQVLRLP